MPTSIHGAEGNDTLDGGDGDDAVHGDDGNDVLRGGTGSEHAHGLGGQRQPVRRRQRHGGRR